MEMSTLPDCRSSSVSLSMSARLSSMLGPRKPAIERPGYETVLSNNAAGLLDNFNLDLPYN